jgi:ABC-type multidrug transport system fused ATPase/permease subunit
LRNIIKNIFTILNTNEKKNFRKLIVLDVVISILDISFLAILLFIVRFYTDPKTISLPAYFPEAIKDQYNLLLIIILFILFSIKNYFGFSVMRKQQKYVYDIATRLSQQQLQNYLQGNYTDYVSIDSSVQIRKISQMPIEFGHYVLAGLQQIISQSILIFVTLVAIFIYNPILLPLLFAILGPPLILMGFIMKKKLSHVRQIAKTSGEKALQHLKEALAGFIECNFFGRKKFFSQRFESSQSKFNGFLADQQVIQNMPSRLIEVFAIFGLFLLIVINSILSPDHSVQVITSAAFLAAAYKIIPGIVKILNNAGQLKTYAFTTTELLRRKENITEPATRERNPTIQCVEFHDVSFRYNGKPVIDNFSLSILKGKFVGITGQSGKGKTTIINLLLGFLDTNEGSIRINDIPTTPEDRKAFWKKISYVQQEPLILHDTVMNNITLDEEFYSTEHFTKAVRVTNLEKLVRSQNKEMAALINENGKNISGGQRQRIAIARALYKTSDLIILDEPFNELDRKSENQLLNFFRDMAHSGKIVILITHNKESLSFCDKIISLDEK